MTEEGFQTDDEFPMIQTPRQLKQSYENSAKIRDALARAITAVNHANAMGEESVKVKYDSDRISKLIMAKFQAKGYTASISSDHGEEMRGEYYSLLCLDWSKMQGPEYDDDD